MSEETGARRRLSSRRSISETALPAEYLERLETKRKQLDESIHKFIAAKERDYKTFEKEIKQEYRLAQGQDGSNSNSRMLSENGEDGVNGTLASQHIAAVDTLSMQTPTPTHESASTRTLDGGSSIPSDQSRLAQLPDGSTRGGEREKYLEGLFTPAYLSALEIGTKPRLERSTSDPPMSSLAHEVAKARTFERANSDTCDQAKPKRPSQLVLAQRTSSSGSSADGRLASAMRSPTHRPKHKRVSLAVGDSIVAPSDSVPTAMTQNTISSHSRKRSQVPEREYPATARLPNNGPDDQSSTATRVPSRLAEELIVAPATLDAEEDLSPLPPAAAESESNSGLVPKSRVSKIDPDGDLFGLEDEDSDESLSKPDLDDDQDNALESEDDITGRVEVVDEPVSPSAASARARYDPTTGVIPEPKDEKEDSAVPYLAFGPSSAIAPREPGFRRPSVVDDPVYIGPDYQAAERNAVENDVYGSSANRPVGRSSFTAGSLGESYMAQHAEEMMRLRSSRQQAQVRS